jgi:hypothetical protein
LPGSSAARARSSPQALFASLMMQARMVWVSTGLDILRLGRAKTIDLRAQ